MALTNGNRLILVLEWFSVNCARNYNNQLVLVDRKQKNTMSRKTTTNYRLNNIFSWLIENHSNGANS